MYFVYVLYSRVYEKIYIGMTSDLVSRFRWHNALSRKGWTVRYRPWELVHVEVFTEKRDALRRERALKSASGRRYVWGLIQEMQDRSKIQGEVGRLLKMSWQPTYVVYWIRKPRLKP